jgi:predicted ATPase
MYAFSHALTREVIYWDSILPRRQRLHLRAAEAIEDLYARMPDTHIATLAGHYRLAGESAVDKAIEYSLRAGDAAAAVYAWEEAALQRQAALELLERCDPPTPAIAAADARPTAAVGRLQRCEVLLSLADAQSRAGDGITARESFRRAVALARQIGREDGWGQAGTLLARAALGLGGRLVWVPAASVDDVSSIS